MTQQIAKWAYELCERQGRQRPRPKIRGVWEIVVEKEIRKASNQPFKRTQKAAPFKGDVSH